ncbi:MAG: polymorphic toxin-type HINT domain-containing protein [Patescibacteria group bacterium]
MSNDNHSIDQSGQDVASPEQRSNNHPSAVKKFLNRLVAMLSVKRLALAALILLVAAALVQFVWRSNSSNQLPNEFDGYARLTLSSAHALDNFTLEPTDGDVTGVAADSAYILKSQEQIATSDLLAALKIEPKLAVDVTEIGPNEWRIDTLEPAPTDAVLTVSLTAEYIDDSGDTQQRLYSWAHQVRNQFKVLTTIPRHQGTNVPVNTGIEFMFSHVGVGNMAEHFNLMPPAIGQFETHGRTVVFVPTEPLEYGTIYTVTLTAGLKPDDAKEGLTENQQFSFETESKSDYRNYNYVWANSDLYEFPVNEPPAIAVGYNYGREVEVGVEVFELNGVDALLATLAERDRFPQWSNGADSYQQDVSALNKISTFTARISGGDGSQTYIEFPTGLPAGVYVVNLTTQDNIDQFWLQITDLAAYINVTATDTVVWANDRSANQPADNVTLSGINVTLSGQTDARGIATLPTPEILISDAPEAREGGRPYLKLVGSSGELLLQLIDHQAYDYYRATSSNQVFSDKFWTYLSTDRPRYQTDDTVHVWGVLKPRQTNQIVGDVRLTLYKEGYRDYYYRPVRIIDRVVSLAADGNFTLDLPLEKLRPDYYSLELSIDGQVVRRQYVNVEPYEKPAYELTIAPEKFAFYVEEVVPIYIDAKFFDGTPVPNVELIYNDGTGDRTVRTDSAGRVTMNYQLAYSSCENGYYSCWPRYNDLRVWAASAELGEISASTSVRVYGPNVYLSSKTTYPESNVAEVHYDFKKIDDDKLNGENDWWSDSPYGNRPAPGTNLTLRVTRIKWNKIETGTYYDFVNKVTRKTYHYERSESVVDNLTGQADANGQYVYRRTVEPETQYEVALTFTDSLGRSNAQTDSLYYFDGQQTYNYDWWSNEYRLKFSADKTYQIGDKVQVELVRGDEAVPSGDNNRFLFLQLQNGLQEISFGDQSSYEFPFERRDVPNIHLTGVWWNGRTFVSASTSDGWRSSAIRAATEPFELSIDITTDQATYEPGEEAEVSVSVKNAAGQPTAASVNLSLIDEAYFAVADSGLPSPLESLYASLSSGSFFSQSTHELPKEMSSTAEGGGCFAAGTLITLADGTRRPIERIVTGDQVATFANPLSRRPAVGEVTETFVHTVDELLIVNDSLRLTPEHRVFSNHGFLPAGDLRLGDWLLRENGQRVEVTNLQVATGRFTVYNFRVDPQHTFFADGFYVHNDKGGIRSVFVDVAHFGTLTTGRDGRGSVKITLPDNITSWRITAQAVDGQLNAGSTSVGMPVTKPVFVHVSAARNYLLGDQPQVRLTAYGTALSSGDLVTLNIAAPTLGLEKSADINTVPFVGTRFDLPKLQLGTHDITYSLKSAKGDDAVRLPIEVNASYLRVQDILVSDMLTTDTTLPDTNGEPAAVVLADAGQNQLYSPLLRLSWSWGHRVDQRLSSRLAAQMLNERYGERLSLAEFDGRTYQIQGGGLTLLPYSDADMELSARLADLAADEFDRLALANYFFTALNSQNSTDDEITWSLYGLATMGEPVLPQLQVWSNRTDLSPRNRLYVALALDAVGDAERARQVYLSVAEQFAEQKGIYNVIRSSEDASIVAQDTALAALLTAALNLPEHVGYWNYVTTERPKDVLLNLEQINYIERLLPFLNAQPARVRYEIAGEKFEAQFTGRAQAFQVAPQHLASVKFTEIEGDVAYSVRVSRPATDSELRLDETLGLSREYRVNGQATTSFKEGDLIKVILTPTFTNPIGHSYQLTDILPSGLAAVSSPWTFGRYEYSYCDGWRPYVIDDQRISFLLNKNQFGPNGYCKSISYWARVIGTGEYRAEPALLQNFLAPEIRNASGSATVTIN